MKESTLALCSTHSSVQSMAEYSNENSMHPSSGAARHATTTANTETMLQV